MRAPGEVWMRGETSGAATAMLGRRCREGHGTPRTPPPVMQSWNAAREISAPTAGAVCSGCVAGTGRPVRGRTRSEATSPESARTDHASTTASVAAPSTKRVVRREGSVPPRERSAVWVRKNIRFVARRARSVVPTAALARARTSFVLAVAYHNARCRHRRQACRAVAPEELAIEPERFPRAGEEQRSLKGASTLERLGGLPEAILLLG
jgi:hypothetical protein